MSVRIRLRRMGRKKQPHYRVVVADSHAPRDGRIVENLGYYRPKATPARLVLDLERVDYWIGHGAKPSETVSSLVRRARQGGGPGLALGEPDREALAAPAPSAQAGGEAGSRDGASAVEAAAGGEGGQAGAPRADAEAQQQGGESKEGGGAAEGAGQS